jgi:hypothetical protein
MSHRYDTAWIAGAHLYGDSGLGVLGADIPATGDNGASFLYNDLSLPADSGKEICGRITSWPTNGTLDADETGAFTYTPFSDGLDSFTYQLKVDGADVGAPATVTLQVGDAPVTITAGLGTATAQGYSAVVSSPSDVFITATLATATAGGLHAAIQTASFGGSLSDEDIARIVVAVMAAMNATTVPVNIKKVNDVTIRGTGVMGDTWGPI